MTMNRIKLLSLKNFKNLEPSVGYTQNVELNHFERTILGKAITRPIFVDVDLRVSTPYIDAFYIDAFVHSFVSKRSFNFISKNVYVVFPIQIIDHEMKVDKSNVGFCEKINLFIHQPTIMMISLILLKLKIV
jgi:hypothetical protein